ncbi:hypothetical protein M1L60_23625 [Actinoplanes sp. TRM 88003]|uniref:DUF1573 domain-containing protein n=1 Tax=Paractinoplanes aksuensis TaxID=2939490 RepID=A0ABT1DRX8_9ACTN|nr:hypothetical protein [Actinoplanes aksuensis]MCO8273588.1 hypothetical protein [Actinoplanes aksuensis]
MIKPRLLLVLAAAALAGACSSSPKTEQPALSLAVTSHTCDVTIPGAEAQGHFCTITITVRNTTTAAVHLQESGNTIQLG